MLRYHTAASGAGPLIDAHAHRYTIGGLWGDINQSHREYGTSEVRYVTTKVYGTSV